MYKKFLLIAFGSALTINLLLLDYFVITERPNKPENLYPSQILETQETKLTSVSNDSCGQLCQETIAQKVKEEISKSTPIAGQSSVSPLPKPTVMLPTPTVQKLSAVKLVYIPLTLNGSTVNTSWEDVVPSEFMFDSSNFPGAKEVRFEAYLLALHGSAEVYARLYDQTNQRGVDFSDLKTTSDSFARLESGPIRIWHGNNKYTVQLKSLNGTQIDLQNAKLKIIY